MKYDSKTGTLHKIGEVRHNLYIVDEAVEQLRKIKGMLHSYHLNLLVNTFTN